jgi:hypothetical protein
MLAFGWLLARRLICFCFAAALIGGVIFNASALIQGSAPPITALWIILGLVFAAFIAWVGIFGIAGGYLGFPGKYRLEDTKMLYRLRKKRYGWRW